jgi:hypothetical protein
MDTSAMYAKIKEKYIEIFPKYWESLMQKLENPNSNNIKMYNYLNSIIHYLDKYLLIINNSNDEDIEKNIHKITTIKEIKDALYEPKQNTNIYQSDKVEVLYE